MLSYIQKTKWIANTIICEWPPYVYIRSALVPTTFQYFKAVKFRWIGSKFDTFFLFSTTELYHPYAKWWIPAWHPALQFLKLGLQRAKQLGLFDWLLIGLQERQAAKWESLRTVRLENICLPQLHIRSCFQQ